MWRRGLCGAVLLFAGCQPFKDFKQEIGGLTESTVAAALLLSVLPPDDEALELEGTELSPGTTADIVLVDADSSLAVGDMAPVDGAVVAILGDPMGLVPAAPAGAGAYRIDVDGGLVYQAEEVWTVQVTPPSAQDEMGLVDVRLPIPPDVSPPAEHETGVSFVMDLGGQQFHAATVTVIDTFTGEVTFTSGPSDVESLADAAHSDSFVGPVEVPGVAFPRDSVYALAVGGLVHQLDDGIVGLNTAFTGLLAGQVRVFPVSTLPAPP